MIPRDISGLVDGKGTEQNWNEEDADVTSDLVNREGAEEKLGKKQDEDNEDVTLGPVDGEKAISEDHGKKNQDDGVGEVRTMKRSKMSSTTEN